MKCKNCKNRFKRRDDDGSLYDWCGMIVDSPDAERERQCKYYAVASNSDYMRAMSDEELAEWIEEISPHTEWKYYLQGRTWLDWLKQECSNE